MSMLCTYQTLDLLGGHCQTLTRSHGSAREELLVAVVKVGRLISLVSATIESIAAVENGQGCHFVSSLSSSQFSPDPLILQFSSELLIAKVAPVSQ